MSYLEKLSIKGFKAFTEETSIAFKKLTVLAGANSVGKSSVIQAILLGKTAVDVNSISFEGRNISDRPRILLNGNYNLALGTTRQVTTSPRIQLHFGFMDGNIKFELEAPIDKTYLETTDNSKIEGNNIFFWDFHYLSAERLGPRPWYDESLASKFIGHQGEYAVQLLVEGLTFDTSQSLNFNYVTKSQGQSNDNLADQTNLWMQYIIPDINLSVDRLKEVNKSVASVNNHTMPNVGFGISYVLPIVIAGLIASDKEFKKMPSLLIIENPEAHLHPSGQSRIGEFLAAVAAQEGVQVIIETHSEHVINGIRVAALKNYIKPSDILVNFLHRDEKNNRKIQIRPIEIKENGEFSSFPPGFFDQAAQDLIQMTKFRMKKK